MSLVLPRRTLALVLLVLAPALFASNNIAARLADGVIAPATLAFWRWMLAAILLLPFALPGLRDKRGELRGELAHLLFLAFVGMTVVSYTTYAGALTTTASNIGLIYAAAPAAVLMLDWMSSGVRLGSLQIGGLLLCLAGVLFIVLRGDPAALREARFVAGDLIVCVGMLAWALYSVLLKHWPTRLSVLERAAAIAAGGALTTFPLALAEAGGTSSLLPGSVLAIWIVLAVGILSGALLVWLHGFITDELGSRTTVVLLYLIPLYNIALAWLILSEELRAYQAVGGGLVLAGIACAMRGSGPSRERLVKA